MAKQSGIIKLEGTIGDVTFYKSKDGLLARSKGGVDASRIQVMNLFSAPGKITANLEGPVVQGNC